MPIPPCVRVTIVFLPISPFEIGATAPNTIRASSDSPMRADFFAVSAVHGDKKIDDTIQAFEKVLHRMKTESAFDEF